MNQTDFTQHPYYPFCSTSYAGSPQYSPCGSHLAYIAPHDPHPTLWIETNGTARPLIPHPEHPLSKFRWSYHPDYILFEQDQHGNEAWHLYRFNIHTGETKNLTPFSGARVHAWYISPLKPDTIIAIINKDNPSLYDAYEISLSTGNFITCATNPGNVRTWVIDNDLSVRARVVSHPDGGFELESRGASPNEWKHHITWTLDDSFTSGPLWLCADNTHLFLTDSRHNNTAALCKLNLATNELSIILHDKEHDIRNSNISDIITGAPAATSMLLDKHGTLAAISYYKTKGHWHTFTEYGERIISACKERYNGKDFWFTTPYYADALITASESDTQPVTYERLELETLSFSPILTRHNVPAPVAYAPSTPISFTNRTGETLHGYLTTPHSSDPASPTPLVVRIHGGPWARDMWGFDAHTQFLAAHGFSCLRINYRGSSGYGKAFTNAADKQWASKVLDDIEDGVAWACNSKVAHKDMIIGMGRSFGGYLALAQASMRKKLFSHLVVEVPPTHLPTLLEEDLPAHWSLLNPSFFRRIGNPETDRAFLEETSPVNHAENISSPLLLFHGRNDGRVGFAQSEKMASRMREAGKEIEYHLIGNEGHRSATFENIILYYEKVRAFLGSKKGKKGS